MSISCFNNSIREPKSKAPQIRGSSRRVVRFEENLFDPPHMWDRRCVGKPFLDFFAANKENPYVLAISNQVHRENPGEATRLVDLPEPITPNRAALEEIADRYAQKYHIRIHVCDTRNLCEAVQAYSQHVTAPTYVGFITALPYTIETGHVAPLLVQFLPLQQPQFLFMDVLGSMSPDPLNSVKRIVANNFAGTEFVYSNSVRQADEFSCRIGAVVLLRNALLSLSEQTDPQAYWDGVLRQAPTQLPPEWTYGEQIQHSSEAQRMKVEAIRDKFSKSEEKRLHPRSVQQRLLDKSERIQLEHGLFCEWTQDFSEKLFVDAQFPGGAQFEIVQDGIVLRLRVEKTVNTYLLRKGHREAKRAAQNLVET